MKLKDISIQMGAYSWIDIALIVGLVQGLFLAILLPRIVKANKAANRLLAWLLYAASLTVVIYLYSRNPAFSPTQLYILLDTCAFVYGPLIYFYIRTLLFPSDMNNRWVWLHWVPAALHCVYFLVYLRYDNDHYLALARSGALRSEWQSILMVLIALLLSYWGASVKLLLEFKKEEKRVVSFHQNFVYLSVFLAATLVSYLICIIFCLDFFVGIKLFAFTGTNLGWVIVPFWVYFISYFAIAQPEVLKVTYQEEKKSQPRLSTEHLTEYKSKLEALMQQEKLYLDPQLTLNDLAEKLNLNSTKLSWLINENYSCNFYDFVNNYRVNEFVEKLKNNEHQKQTLAALAFDAGFNSKTTFNKSFKKALQATPGEYVRQLKIT